MINSKKIAKALLDVEAVKLNVENPYTFVSGIKSPIYCDNRKVIGFPTERKIIVDAFIKNFKNKEYDIIAGTSTAGIPWSSFISYELNMPTAYIRSKPKEHGAGKQIEGGSVKDKKVIVIEDLISTGGSCISAVEACFKEGAKSVEVVSIFSYNFQTAFEKFKSIDCTWTALSNFEDLLSVAKSEGFLSDKDALTASSWNLNPTSWMM